MKPRYKGSTRAYRRAREQVLRGAVACWICGRGPRPGDPFVTDHIIPRALGGGDHLSNLAPAHRSCNARKGAKPPQTVQAAWL